MSLKAEIMQNLATRLASITTANGYTTNVKQVYFDKIPMGLELADHEVPAIFLMERIDNITLKIDQIDGNWEIFMQLWHNVDVPDSTMHDFVRDVFKAIYANSPTGETHGAFRALHSHIVSVSPISISSDLQMIDANRVYELSFVVRYRTKLFNL